jgi:hypothetical protein
VEANLGQVSPTFISAAACEGLENVSPITRITAVEIAIDENFFFIGSPFLRLGNKCRTVGEDVIAHGSYGLSRSHPRGQPDLRIMAR